MFHGMDQTPRDSLVARVRGALGEFHPSERRLADVVLSFPGDIASYTATELAQLANVSNATVSRFVRKIGYGSFEEARQAVRAEQRAGAPLFRVGSGGMPFEGAVAAHLEQSRLNLDRTAAALDAAEIDGLAEAALAAPRVRVGGFRAGQPMARYLGWQLQQVIPDVAVFPRDGETLAEGLTALGPGDCVIVVALRRAPALLPEAVAAAHDSGAALALIGDLPGLDALPARWRFGCATSAPGPLLNHVAVMAVCNLIAARAIELSGAEGRRRMSAIEEGHARLGEL
jgi:DNA-binding MurR/RpiR family transcriptional regulator